MKALLGAGTLILGLAAAPPAAAIDLNDGPATVTLDVCGGGNPVQPMYVSNCTYVRFPKRPLNGALESFVYWTDQGKVTWQGTLTGNTLTFPAAGQTWPTLVVGTGSTDQVNPTDISGTIDANGKVDLSWPYSFTLSSNLVCTLSQTVQLSSAGTEVSTGAQGRQTARAIAVCPCRCTTSLRRASGGISPALWTCLLPRPLRRQARRIRPRRIRPNPIRPLPKVPMSPCPRR
ncbi:MAG: hypothetical protein MUF33_12275 [Candidatus Nanopelagicales bacterium]|nr:hypothetical protein [Candidatus Nanopelagicales bacterium]